MVDHFIAILEVSDDRITVGDPLHGIKTYSHADFAKSWRFAGIVLRRQGS